MSNLQDWVQNQSTQKTATINGRELLQKTIKNISLKDVGQGFVEGVLGCLPALINKNTLILIGVLMGVAIFTGNNINGIIVGVVVIGILILVSVILSSLKSTGEVRRVIGNPNPVTDEHIQEKGGRDALPSEVEKLVFHVRKIVEAGGANLKPPERWIVVNDQKESSSSLGNCIFLSRTALQGDYLGALVAYELKRFNDGDGVIRLALSRLNTSQSQLPYKDEWVKFWRQQVFAADEFTAKVGYKRELIDYLEHYQPLETAKPLYDQEEPYVDERIERLKALST